MDEDHDQAQVDGQNEGYENGNQEENIEQVVQVVLPQNHRGRGYSPGLFGSLPNQPIVTRIANNEIESGPASRTLLAIMHRFWREGVVSQTDIDRMHPGWWNLVLTEFERYYAFNLDYATQENARDSIMHHMQNNIRKIINCEKTRADKKIREHGGTYENYRPAYLREGVWKKFCEWWRTDQFRKRSVAARGCRGKVRIPHTSGSHSFERRRRDYVVKNKKEPSVLEHFKELHSLRENGALISPEAKNIMFGAVGEGCWRCSQEQEPWLPTYSGL
ncbi:uncharacterized protein LOC141723342 isoform X1 [Apium graveolens]|uniref:uncharacterized protein LOC141723342 isoform X1 n=1 Tax=Apium graveolens TaxID=4045 RepID=UPI003D7B119A